MCPLFIQGRNSSAQGDCYKLFHDQNTPHCSSDSKLSSSSSLLWVLWQGECSEHTLPVLQGRTSVQNALPQICMNNLLKAFKSQLSHSLLNEACPHLLALKCKPVPSFTTVLPPSAAYTVQSNVAGTVMGSGSFTATSPCQHQRRLNSWLLDEHGCLEHKVWPRGAAVRGQRGAGTYTVDSAKSNLFILPLWRLTEAMMFPPNSIHLA